MERATVIQNGKYYFTDFEKQEIAVTLANKQVDKTAVEDEKKSSMSDFKDQIDRLSLDINKMSRLIINGYENRDFGMHVKRFIDIRTKNVIDERPLDPSDYQGQFDDLDEKDVEPATVNAAPALEYAGAREDVTDADVVDPNEPPKHDPSLN